MRHVAVGGKIGTPACPPAHVYVSIPSANESNRFVARRFGGVM